MARDGSGTFTLPYPTFTPNTLADADQVTANATDIIAALTASIAKDGQTTPTANLPMGGYMHTGVGDASARDSYAAVGQIQDGGLTSATDTGAADAYVITLSPAITAYGASQRFSFEAANANTGTSTLAVNGLAATTIKKHHDQDLASGDIEAGQIVVVEYDGTNFQMLSQLATGLSSSDIGTSVQGYDADTLKADTADVLTVGFAATPSDQGTKSTGTFTPDEANGNLQYAVNGGAHTLAPPTNNCTLVIQYTNNASAGTITTSGFTLVDGDTISTTNGDDFFFYITKCNGFSHLTVKALQ